jgi:hypothetical protein
VIKIGYLGAIHMCFANGARQCLMLLETLELGGFERGSASPLLCSTPNGDMIFIITSQAASVRSQEIDESKVVVG